MAARTEKLATSEFGDLVDELAEAAEADVSVDPAEDHGWLVESGSTLVVTDHESGLSFLVSVQRIDG